MHAYTQEEDASIWSIPVKMWLYTCMIVFLEVNLICKLKPYAGRAKNNLLYFVNKMPNRSEKGKTSFFKYYMSKKDVWTMAKMSKKLIEDYS